MGSSGDWTWRSGTASWRKWPLSWVVTSGLDCREWQGRGNPGRKSSRSKSGRAPKGLGVWEEGSGRTQSCDETQEPGARKCAYHPRLLQMGKPRPREAERSTRGHADHAWTKLKASEVQSPTSGLFAVSINNQHIQKVLGSLTVTVLLAKNGRRSRLTEEGRGDRERRNGGGGRAGEWGRVARNRGTCISHRKTRG